MITKKIGDFNWEKYENWNGVSLTVNEKIKGQDKKTKVYSFEPYAQEMFAIYTNQSKKFIRKDLEKGDIIPIVDLSVSDISGKIIVETLGGLSLEIDLEREKRFLQIYGFNSIDDFVNSMTDKNKVKEFIDLGISAYVTESIPNLKISLWQGHIKKTRDEFLEQINSPSKAYIAKILRANRGGFFVDVQGIEAFMPGSLAAPNKIIDFDSYVGKEVIVMVEDFLEDMNSFIFSHKRYVEHVLPYKIQELSLNEKYTGVVTGTSKYGVFAEFKEIFTGLLHKSKMKEDTYNRFKNNGFNPGDSIEFYISEITKDNRIILTEESPEEKKERISKFVEKYNNKPIECNVSAIMNFGIIVNVEDFSGIVPNKNFKKAHVSPKNFTVGDKIKLKVEEIKEGDKIIFEFWNDKEDRASS